MDIVFTRFASEHSDAVRQFNARLLAGGMGSQFPTSPVPEWLPPTPGSRLYQEYFVGLDREAAVRGAYILKHQDFQIGDRAVGISDLRLPISEGTVNREFVSVAGYLLFDALKRNPLLFGLGMGGYGEAVARWFQAARWTLVTVPFFFRVVHPFRFFRQIAVLRRSRSRRCVLDFAAWTGLGGPVLKSIQALRTRHRRDTDGIAVEPVREFGPWADTIWQRCHAQYGMLAIRTSDVLRALYPAGDPRFLRLRINRNREPVGWSVLLDTRCENHRHFGSMRLGSVVDGLSSASDAADVVLASTRTLIDRGVDLIISNQSHAAWRRAFDENGYLQGPSNFLMGTSPKLSRLLVESGVGPQDMHLNRGDGDGPIHL